MINDNENEAAKIKSRLQRYNMKRPRPRHGQKILHLSNIWSSIHEEVKQHWGWVEKKRCLLKKACIHMDYTLLCNNSTNCPLSVSFYNKTMSRDVFRTVS